MIDRSTNASRLKAFIRNFRLAYDPKYYAPLASVPCIQEIYEKSDDPKVAFHKIKSVIALRATRINNLAVLRRIGFDYVVVKRWREEFRELEKDIEFRKACSKIVDNIRADLSTPKFSAEAVTGKDGDDA